MRTLIQRVNFASLKVDDKPFSKIEKGLLILLGVESEDSEDDIIWLSNKVSNLRIFNDENGVMNLSVKDILGDVMVVSQFTLFASTKKGNRPSYIRSAKPEISEPLYQQFVDQIKTDLDKDVATGEFGGNMKINFENDGPVTIMIDSKNRE